MARLSDVLFAQLLILLLLDVVLHKRSSNKATELLVQLAGDSSKNGPLQVCVLRKEVAFGLVSMRVDVDFDRFVDEGPTDGREQDDAYAKEHLALFSQRFSCPYFIFRLLG